jgi:hypothetical protein
MPGWFSKRDSGRAIARRRFVYRADAARNA